MQTVYETRRQRLDMLIARHGKLADFNEAMGYERNTAKFARLRRAHARKERPGKAYLMGDAVAREIEEKMKLPTGWMDTPPTHSELNPDDRISRAVLVMEKMTPYQLDQACAFLLRWLNHPPETAPKADHGPDHLP